MENSCPYTEGQMPGWGRGHKEMDETTTWVCHTMPQTLPSFTVAAEMSFLQGDLGYT